MKFIIIILTIGINIAFGQPRKENINCEKEFDTLTNREVYNSVDTSPTIIGGMANLYSELAVIKLPKDPEIDQIRIFISFVVEINGDITDLKTVDRITSKTLDKELLELFRKYNWTPGTCNGAKVPTRVVLPIKS